jgi:hypothetical protein
MAVKTFTNLGLVRKKFYTEWHNFTSNPSVVLLSVIIPIVIMISVVVLNVVAP